MSDPRPAPRSRESAPATVIARRPASAQVQDHRAPRTALAAYTAFRERHYEPYLQYASLRIGRRGAAEGAVTAAFTELAVSWTVILGSAGPAACAWRILHDHVDRALGCGPTAVPDSQVVQGLQHDAHFLHEQMHLSRDRIAEVLGIRPGDLPSLPPRSPEE
ncbi:hypothetical protein [Streptomyces sp. DT2A-34]|uniref:hypothetical protein n=1 Tax=unclassified Streptomyces TaxID=2593676 RepID=UPI00265BA1A6|nr:hypothetical protein [Streptomyces sp. DT2A-34]MDO0917811.1 hypothetical protein [Streptomyces sp. DT2A-34]